MNMILKRFLSMSCSGTLLILALFLGKRFWKERLSRQWQYYIWLPVILRLLIPFGAEINLMGKSYQAVDRTIIREAVPAQKEPLTAIVDSFFVTGPERGNEQQNTAALAKASTAGHFLGDTIWLLTNHIWLVWLVAALGLLIRKAADYQRFVWYVRAGLLPVSDMDILDGFALALGEMGIKRPVELCVNPRIPSPLLMGFFRPCVVLPSVNIPEKDIRYIVLHELTHYKRKDMFYKWLVQVTVCLHWFNPFVYLMSREMTKACEFSCDEAVLVKTGYADAQKYGRTLLDAMTAAGQYKKAFGAVTLSGNKKIMKERLGAIMKCERKSVAVRIVTGVLTLGMILGASFLAAYPVSAADQMPGETARQYYEADSLPLFQMVFPRLSEKEQLAWLERFYADGDIAFFSVAVRALDENDPLRSGFAEKAYVDEDAAFFSVLTDYMDKEELELWLDRALEEGRWGLQSILFDKLGKNEEEEKAWSEQQTAEYRAAGVTVDGKNYYYQGQLVNIFLDIRADQSCYVLSMNPAGIVNVKILRGEEGAVTGAAYMSEAEAEELLGDWNDSE